MRDAWPEDTEDLILKHHSISSSSKYEAKFASPWKEKVLWRQCAHNVADHVTPPKLLISEMPPQRMFPGGTRGAESLKHQLLWGLCLQQALPLHRSLQQQGLCLPGAVWPSNLEHPFCGVPYMPDCWTVASSCPQILWLFGTSESCSFVLLFLFHRKQKRCCVSILARNEREQATCQTTPEA